MHMVATEANGQPAYAMYVRGLDGSWAAFQLQVITLSATRISHVAAFFDTALFTTFGLPLTLPADDPSLSPALA
jgi:RNA polymerase sigma-70 factor (ECF subfamily)